MTLENLVQIRQLKVEAADKREFEGLLQSATDRLTDVQNDTLSYASRLEKEGVFKSRVLRAQ